MANVGNKLVDKRIVERNMAKGLISKEQYEQYLADLADREGGYDRIAVETGDGNEDLPQE